jgi:DNA-binding CsgD family transcriptional regulator
VLPIVHRFLQRFRLSTRETEAVIFMVHGLRAKQIAQHMCCSEKSVYAHLARGSKKVGCHDYHEVVCVLLAFACHVLNHDPLEPAPPIPPSTSDSFTERTSCRNSHPFRMGMVGIKASGR